MMLVATAVNVALPYKNYEDGGTAGPSTTWPGSPGRATAGSSTTASRRCRISKSLMLEHWLQQMAEVRYNILAKAPVPVDWMPDEAAVEPASGRPDLADRPPERLPGLRRGAARSLEGQALPAGWAAPARVDRLTRGESIESFEYPRRASPLR